MHSWVKAVERTMKSLGKLADFSPQTTEFQKYLTSQVFWQWYNFRLFGGLNRFNAQFLDRRFNLFWGDFSPLSTLTTKETKLIKDYL